MYFLQIVIFTIKIVEQEFGGDQKKAPDIKMQQQQTEKNREIKTRQIHTHTHTQHERRNGRIN